MSTIRYLDIDDLNSRLADLEGLRETLNDAMDNLIAAQENLDAATEAHKDEATESEEEIELTKARDEAQTDADNADAAFGKDERAELAALEALKDEIGERRGKISEDNGPFVHENDFTEYAEQLAEDIGAIDPKAGGQHGT